MRTGGPVTGRASRDLRQAWILHIISEKPIHGYKLRKRLSEEAEPSVIPDASLFYRWLREFEEKKYLRSRWEASTGGPERRVYRLTPKGKRRLAELAGNIQAAQALYNRFIATHDATPRIIQNQ